MKDPSDVRGAYYYRRLLGYLRRHRMVVAAAVVAMLLTAVAEWGFAVLIKPIMDKGFVQPDPEFIRRLPWYLGGVLVLRAAAGFVSTYLMAWIGRRVVFDLRSDVFTRMIRLPAQTFDSQPSATLVSKVIYDVDQVATSTTEALTLLVKDLLTALGLLGWLLYLDWKLTLIFLIFAPMIFVAVRISTRRFRRTSLRIQDAVGELARVVKEASQGYRIVKTFGGYDYETENFRRANNRNRQLVMKRETVAAAVVPIVLLSAGLGLTAIISFALQRAGAQGVTAGTFVSYLAAVLMLMSPLKRLAKVNERVQVAIAAAQSLFTFMDQPAENDTGTKESARAAGAIEFRGVNFGYAGVEREVLRGISFRIEPGQTVALVGSSGAGKSTITALLLRLYEPERGTILLDGTDIRELTLASLRANIAIVTQDTILFDDSIRNNIAYGHAGRDAEERVRQAAKAAHVIEFTDQMPLGLDTPIGERGIRLSGGQRQRIAIARALFKDAPILVLDEATSSLDTISERLVHEATEQIKRGRTTLVIAHRLSTIEQADRILVLEDGGIAEAGRHAELMARGGVYARLYRSRSLEAPEPQRVTG